MTTARLHFDMVVIGFGKGGKTLAGAYAKTGKNVALIEQSSNMYGGTCINIGCVPTKALVHRADEFRASGEHNAEVADAAYESAVIFRDKLTGAMRAKNREILESNATAKLIDGHARFLSDTEVEVTAGEDKLVVTADCFIINTGAVATIPPIPGARESKRVLTSTELQKLTPRPKRLGIIGGGPIGVEFAGIFSSYGTEVTLLEGAPALFGRYDDDVAQAAREIIADQGITAHAGVRVETVTDNADSVTVNYLDSEGASKHLEVDYVMVATGRKPATEGLGLENTSIETTEHGAIAVDEHLRTTAPNIFALGDVNGGPQFTYISLDDYRVVLSQLLGDGSRSTKDRQAVAATIYMNPPLSSVGLTERDALAAGHTIKVAAKPVAAIAAMPRAKTLENPRGIMKFVIDAETDQILGAQLLVVESMEVINLVALAMRHNITVSQLRDEIYTHPSITEGLNEVLAVAQPVA